MVGDHSHAPGSSASFAQSGCHQPARGWFKSPVCQLCVHKEAAYGQVGGTACPEALSTHRSAISPSALLKGRRCGPVQTESSPGRAPSAAWLETGVRASVRGTAACGCFFAVTGRLGEESW